MSLKRLTSGQNERFKWLKNLMHRKYREREGLFILEGERLVSHALQMGIMPLALFFRVDKVELFTNRLSRVVEALEEAIPCYCLDDKLFNEVSDTMHSQGLIGVFKQGAIGNGIRPSRHIVVVDQIQDPGNLGTLLRTCDAFGLNQVYLMKGTVDPFSQKVLRSTMGSIFNLALYQNRTLEDLVALKDQGYRLVSTALARSIPLDELSIDPALALAICFGNEGRGVSDAVLDMSDTCIKIPMRGGAESLNVATAAAVVLYHIQRDTLKGQDTPL